jgi:hypothetical protein
MEIAYSVQGISLILIHASHSVQDPLNGPQHRIYGGALTVKYASHEHPERLRHEKDEAKEQ